MRNLNKKTVSEATFAWLLTGVFFAVASFTLLNHEMWRDELQAWLLARDSNGPFELFQNLKYERHPGLWHLLLMPLSRMFRSPEVMQWLHL